ncbi:hypothetical protein AVEN_85973-1 [Araneus ventricosus]|uniref:Uncharacterized protein n=1 Tax=Araneus ventricosus TaxID=182803 RepID=A0A4Y2PKQ4_ARAVE|nr:hypothetical protein AVEN_85973-1 [Araneus ventricosus]
MYQSNTSTELPPNPTILLYPTTNSSSNLSELLNETLPPRDFHPTNIKPLRGNGLAMSFLSPSHIKNFQSKLEENINLKSSIKTKLPTKRSPSCILYNVPITTKEKVIQEALKSQLNLSSPLKLRFSFKGHSTTTTNWVFKTSASTLNTIHQVQKIQLVNSTTSTIVQTDNLNIEETTSKELLTSVHEIITGGTISISKEGRTIFRAHLNKDLTAIANKLVDAIERNQNISNSTVKETADSRSNRTVDVREIGIQCNENSSSPDPSAQSKNAPTNDTGAETIKSYLKAAKQGHKEKKALIVVPNDSASGSNKDIEAIIRKELPQEMANKIKGNIQKRDSSRMSKRGGCRAIKESIESHNNNVSTRPPGKRHPSLVIYAVPEATTIEEIQKTAETYSEEGMSLLLQVKMKGRKEEKSHIVLEAPSKFFHTLKKSKEYP